MSSPLTFQPVMSLVKGNAAAQPGSSSSLRPCGVLSGFNVTTQVLLRSVVESSHCPIMFFFSVAASCARAGEATTASASAATRQDTKFHQLAFTGVSGTGVSGGLPANQDLRLSTTS